MDLDKQKHEDKYEEDEQDSTKRKWNYCEYLDKVDEELQAGRFASQSK